MTARVTLLLACCFTAVVAGQVKLDRSKLSALNDRLASDTRPLVGASAELTGGPCDQIERLGPETKKQCLDTAQAAIAYEREWYDEQRAELKMRGDGFQWQLTSSKIVFGLVVLVVLAGLAFSATQFYVDLRAKTRVAPTTTAAPADVTTLDVGLDHVKVASPILGVIILAISITFFYLYLKFVYPISELGQDAPSAQTK